MMRDHADRVTGLIERMRHRIGSLAHEWILSVSWTDLLLVSWPLPVEQLRPFLPPPLEVDTFDGFGWISLVSFRAQDMHVRLFGLFPDHADFCELNLRTYVRAGHARGVYFLSLDAPDRLATLIGAHLFHLPFNRCTMRIDGGSRDYRVESRREVSPGERPADYSCRFHLVDQPRPPQARSLDQFLIDRLSLFVSLGGHMFRGDIAHASWMVQPVTVTIEENTVVTAAGIELPAQPPHTAFAPSTHALIYPLARVNVSDIPPSLPGR